MSEHSVGAIKAHLDQRAETDVLFAFKYANPKKNIEDCCTYILNTVHNSGCNGFADDEIFGMAVHYYDEENIEIGKPINCRVVVNHVVELTEEEKAEAHREAIQQFQDEEYRKMKQQQLAKRTKIVALNPQPSLFDF